MIEEVLMVKVSKGQKIYVYRVFNHRKFTSYCNFSNHSLEPDETFDFRCLCRLGWEQLNRYA